MNTLTPLDETSCPTRSTYINAAFDHANTKTVFGSVNKDGKARVLHPYQIQPLDMYFDINDINEYFSHPNSSRAMLAEELEEESRRYKNSSLNFKNNFHKISNFEEMNKMCHRKFSAGSTFKRTQSNQSLESRLNIRNHHTTSEPSTPGDLERNIQTAGDGLNPDLQYIPFREINVFLDGTVIECGGYHKIVMEIPNNVTNRNLKFQDVEEYNKEVTKNEEDLQIFMNEITKRFKQSKPLNNLFLKDGTLINNLNDIPASENILFASRSPFFKGFRKVVTRQKRRGVKGLKPGMPQTCHSEAVLNPDKQIKVAKIYKKVLNEQRKIERLQRREIEKQVEEKKKDMAMSLVKNARNGGPVGNPLTEGGQDVSSYQKEIQTGKNANIVGRRIHNEMGADNSNRSSNCSDLSYHSSSIDENELYSEVQKNFSSQNEFTHLMNRYLNNHPNLQKIVEKKAQKVLKSIHDDHHMQKRPPCFSADRIIRINKVVPIKTESLQNAQQLIREHKSPEHIHKLKRGSIITENPYTVNLDSKMAQSYSRIPSKRQIIRKRNFKNSNLIAYSHNSCNSPIRAKTVCSLPSSPSSFLPKTRNPMKLHSKLKAQHFKVKRMKEKGAHLSKELKEHHNRAIKSAALKNEYDGLNERIQQIEKVNEATQEEYKQLDKDLDQVRDFVKVKNDMLNMNEQLFLSRRECKILEREWNLAYHLMNLKDDKYKVYLDRKRKKEEQKRKSKVKVDEYTLKLREREKQRKLEKYYKEMDILLKEHKKDLKSQSRNKYKWFQQSVKSVTNTQHEKDEHNNIDYLEAVKSGMSLKNSTSTLIQRKASLNSPKYQKEEDKRLVQEYICKKKALDYIKANRSKVFSASKKRSRIFKPPEKKETKPILVANKSLSASISEDTFDEKEEKQIQKNFVSMNKDLNKNLITVKKVDEEYGVPSTLNLEALVEKHGFTREEILKFYVLYKSLCKLTVSYTHDTEVRGVCFDVFINGISELSLENKDLVKRIFDKANVNKKLIPKNNKNKACNAYLDWEEFLICMKTIFTDDLELKIELFFDIVDSDGNGFLDKKEIKEICELSLFEASNGSQTREEVANYFTTFLFKIFNLNEDEDEIPLSMIRNEIFKPDSPHKYLLCMFCNAESIISIKKSKKRSQK
ncbi:unnamed protein product [Moneuplotes crassus]|uniref:EF-hand domain-containing protein n=1 Tax=Euplotes crassus TaxID=5936 RepID=A0AAD1X7U6_EUPCR|nr:unnamed protein product [Moneuplotes crassus]